MPRFLKVTREQIADLQREREMHPKFSPDRLSQNALGAERHLGFCLRRPLFWAILRQPASLPFEFEVAIAPDRHLYGAVTVQPRRRSSSASCSADIWCNICSWADRRHAGAVTGVLPLNSASCSRSINAVASSRVNLPAA